MTPWSPGSCIPDRLWKTEPFQDGLLACLCPHPDPPYLPRGGQEDWHLHNTGLGALAAGLKVVSYEILWNLPGDVAEAAGGRRVGSNCGERKTMSLSHSSEEKARQLLIPEQVRKAGLLRPSNWKAFGLFCREMSLCFCLYPSFSLTLHSGFSVSLCDPDT